MNNLKLFVINKELDIIKILLKNSNNIENISPKLSKFIIKKIYNRNKELIKKMNKLI